MQNTNDSRTSPRSASSLPRMTCEFIEATELVPREWDSWFWCSFSENAPFGFGDNNRTMVCASDFKAHCEDVLSDALSEQDVSQEDIDQFLGMLDELGSMYVDLEN